jgi:hypothetical protein
MRYAIVAALLLTGCSRYDYTERRAEGMTQPVRVDRIGGETEVLTTHGWKPLVRPAPRPAAVSEPLSAECVEARRRNPIPGPYADLLADLPCSDKELASLAESPRQDSTRTQTLP